MNEWKKENRWDSHPRSRMIVVSPRTTGVCGKYFFPCLLQKSHTKCNGSFCQSQITLQMPRGLCEAKLESLDEERYEILASNRPYLLPKSTIPPLFFCQGTQFYKKKNLCQHLLRISQWAKKITGLGGRITSERFDRVKWKQFVRSIRFDWLETSFFTFGKTDFSWVKFVPFNYTLDLHDFWLVYSYPPYNLNNGWK